MIVQDPRARQRALDAYEEAEHALQDFVDRNHDLVEQLRELTVRRNSALVQLDQAARAEQIELGPIRKGRTTTRVDTQKAYQELGEQRFRDIGGTLVTEPKLSAEAARKAINDGLLNQQEAERFMSTVSTYTTPDTYKVP